MKATEIIAGIQSGSLKPEQVVEDALRRVRENAHLAAIQDVYDADARQAARALAGRANLKNLPLAGLPVLIKNNIPVFGHPMRNGSPATSATPAASDHVVVQRLREAGAIIIGSTTVPELCLWATCDSSFGTTRNPWAMDRTPGGSSGGAAAAVAGGIVPVAHGNDGMGSIRIPAANTGLFGIKPGRTVIPAQIGSDSWGGMSENGPLARNVADAALVFGVMAGDLSYANPQEPDALRIAVAPGSPSPLIPVSRTWKRALAQTSRVLRAEGHHMTLAKFPYPVNPLPMFARWFAGAANDAQDLNAELLEPRTRTHARIGTWVQKTGLVRNVDAVAFASAASAFFNNYDVLLTPALAQFPLRAEQWHSKSWFSNIVANSAYAPYAAPWNMVGWPAASIPVGLDSATGLPLAVQAVVQPGNEKLLFSLAVQLERIQPWPLLND
ncbi:MAG TPA: amidase family protein [Actinomycetales bacterium]|nr:amidase family protein [Actinomycetales bacterium]